MAAGADQELVQIAAGLVPLAAEGCTIDLKAGATAVCAVACHVEPSSERDLFAIASRGAHAAQSRCRIVAGGRAVGEIVAWGTRSTSPLGEVLLRSAAGHAGAVLDARSASHRAASAEAGRASIISMVGHEIRAPLQTLTLALELLRMPARDGDDAPPCSWLEQRVDRVERSVLRLNEVAIRLLDISRHEAGVVGLERAEDDLGAVVEGVVRRIRADAEWAGCIVETSAEGCLEGRWDRLHLETVVENLLTNALKYGAGRPVAVCVRGGRSEVQLEVRDSGCGIRREDLPHVFDRFYRGAVPVHHAGLGIGLWISRRLVEAHGGKILCESEHGAGTTFRVRLPRDVRRASRGRVPTGSLREEPER